MAKTRIFGAMSTISPASSYSPNGVRTWALTSTGRRRNGLTSRTGWPRCGPICGWWATGPAIPILMTTCTTILGMLPLAFGGGAGGEIQAALARAVIGGLTISTLITLVLIPAAYISIHNLLDRKRPGISVRPGK